MKALKSLLSYSKKEDKPADVLAAESRFSEGELNILQGSFRSMTSRGHKVAYPTFIAWLRLVDLEPDLASGLCMAVDRGQKAEITYGDFIVALRRVEKGSESDAARFVFRMLDFNRSGVLEAATLQKAVTVCGTRAAKTSFSETKLGEVADSVTRGAFLVKGGNLQQGLEEEEFLSWSERVPTIARFMSSFLGRWSIVPREPPIALPQLAMDAKAQELGLMLDPSWMWMLCGGLPRRYCYKWELLFTKRLHGNSFNTFLGKIKGQGVTLLLIKDANNHTFGGLATLPWEKNGNFFGDFSSFIFSIQPVYAIYKPSGGNQNFQWCGQGFMEIPNGVGFGGRMGYFSLFVDSSFEEGMSRPTATYASPCLASEEVFKIKDVECWLLEKAEEDPWDQLANSASILDKTKEDQRVMELAGKEIYSDAYRD